MARATPLFQLIQKFPFMRNCMCGIWMYVCFNLRKHFISVLPFSGKMCVDMGLWLRHFRTLEFQMGRVLALRACGKGGSAILPLNCKEAISIGLRIKTIDCALLHGKKEKSRGHSSEALRFHLSQW